MYFTFYSLIYILVFLHALRACSEALPFYNNKKKIIMYLDNFLFYQYIFFIHPILGFMQLSSICY